MTVSIPETLTIGSLVGAGAGGLSSALLTDLPAVGGMCMGGVFVLVVLLTFDPLKDQLRDRMSWRTADSLALIAAIVAGLVVTFFGGAAVAGSSIPIGTVVVIGLAAFASIPTLSEWLVNKLGNYRSSRYPLTTAVGGQARPSSL